MNARLYQPDPHPGTGVLLLGGREQTRAHWIKLWEASADKAFKLRCCGKWESRREPAGAVLLIDGTSDLEEALHWVGEAAEWGKASGIVFLRPPDHPEWEIPALARGADECLVQDSRLSWKKFQRVLERARARRLSNRKNRWGFIIDSIPVPIAVTDRANRLLFTNHAWRSQWGKKHGQASSEIWLEGIHGEDLPLWRECIGKVLSSGQPCSVELRLGDGKGAFRWTRCACAPVIFQGDEPAEIIHCFEDIHDLREAESALKKTEREASATEELKSRFLANVTHEIRTPINGILGMNALLLGTKLTPEQRELAETLRNSGKALLRIIEDILDFARLEANQLPMECLPFHLLSVVEETVELLAESAREKNIELICSVEPDVPESLLGDAGRIRQVLINLLGNALKFTQDEGETIVRASLQREDESTAWIILEVEDTGIGICPSIQPLLFQAFVQADQSTTRKHAGSGLGLAISKELVKRMNGTIRLKSLPGHGTSLHLEIPFPKDPEHPTPTRDSGNPPCPWEGQKALVIESNATARKTLAMMLRQHGLDCRELDRMEQVESRLKEEAGRGGPFALVMLPVEGEDGILSLRTLARSPWLHATPIVALIRHPVLEEPMVLKQAGAADYLTKPVRPSRLPTLLGRLFNPPPRVD